MIGFYNNLTLTQCSRHGACVADHVIDVGASSVSVSRADGGEMELVVWQDRDDVVRYSFTLSSPAGGTGKRKNIFTNNTFI